MSTANNEPLETVVSHYRVLRLLGAGGMGEVYEGFDETLKRRVAMKAIRPRKRLDPEAKARFLREARILSQLDHPNICRVYDYLETDERDWLVLELIEGRTLREVIHDGHGAIDPLAVARQIASVLAVMHAAGVVHRDLKPGNVMITPANEVKVLDFGLSAPAGDDEVTSAPGTATIPDDPEVALSSAQLADSAWAAGPMSVVGATAFRSQEGAVIGTAAYMSPEQGRGEPATPASDIYSFGLLTEEVFAGRLRHDATAVPEQRVAGPRVEHRIPADVRTLIDKLLAPAPSQRPTAEAVVERLGWIADAPRRRRQRLAVVALVILVLGGIAKYTWDLSHERAAAVAARDEADRRREQAENLIGFMVGDLRTRLTAVGRLEILDEVGQKALEYFQSVPPGALTGEELYRRSQTMHQLGQVRQARADSTGALKAYEESLALAESLVRSDPQNPVWQLGLGTSHFYVGDIKRRRGDLDSALRHFQQYQDIARRLVERDPANLEWKLELSYGYSNVAAILSGQGNYAAAREQLELTRDIQTELAQARPDDTAIQTSRANNFDRLGVVDLRLGAFGDAAASFTRELEIYERLGQQQPGNARNLRRIAVSQSFLGEALRAQGRHDEALAAYQAARDGARRLVALDPANADWRRDLGVYEQWVGRSLLAGGQSQAALESFRRSMSALRALAGADAARSRRDLAQAQTGAADALARLGQPGAAMGQADEAEAILTALVADDPRSVEAVRDLAILHNLRGALWQARGDSARARESWNAALGLLTPLAEPGGDYSLVDPFVRASALLGRLAEARRGYDRLMALGYRDRGFMNFWRQHAASDGDAKAAPPLQ